MPSDAIRRPQAQSRDSSSRSKTRRRTGETRVDQKPYWILLFAGFIFLRAVPFQFILSNINPDLTGAENAAANAGNRTLYPYIIYLLALTSGYLVIKYRVQFYQYLAKAWPLLAFAGFALVSCAWSDDPLESFRSVIGLITILAIGVGMSVYLKPKDQITALSYTFLASMALSILFALLLPHYGVHQKSDAFENVHAGRWRGIYQHKNGLGPMAGAGCILFLATTRSIIREPYRLFMAAVCVAVLLLSASVTATVCTVVTLAIFAMFKFTRGSLRIILGALLIGVVCILFMTGADPRDLFTSATGRDTTLTGRTTIWEFSLAAVWRSPILGYGWQSGYGGLREALIARLGVNHPHNNFIDIALSLGGIGLIIYLVWIGVSVFYMVSYWRKHASERQAVETVAYLLIFWTMLGFSESMLNFTAPYAVVGVCILASIPFWGAATSRRAQPSRQLEVKDKTRRARLRHISSDSDDD